MTKVFAVFAALMFVGGIAVAEGHVDEPHGVYCESNGAQADNVGAWFKGLEENVAQFEGENPAEIAETEDETWNETANLGELVTRHCTTPADDVE